MTLHEHCLRLRGLDPDDTRTFTVRQYADLSHTPVGFPVGPPIREESFSVPVRHCYSPDGYFSLTLAGRYIERTYGAAGWVSMDS